MKRANRVKSLRVNSHPVIVLSVTVFATLFLLLSSVAFGQGPIDVKYTEGRISVIAEDRTFGEVLDAMSREAKFSHKLPPELSSTRISIRMFDSEMDRAVTRLFSLVQEKNYKVKYGPGGEVSVIEVIKAGTKSRTAPGTEVSRGSRNDPERSIEQDRTTSRRFNPRRRVTRRYNPRRVRPSGQPAPAATPQDQQPTAADPEDVAVQPVEVETETEEQAAQ
ncbi:MAG: hypothetical protein JSV21_00510 [Nitrospirota bacterium]|nr:MAG: hypothetical protein JSV21_00510 [Nitrospirota bacterium]